MRVDCDPGDLSAVWADVLPTDCPWIAHAQGRAVYQTLLHDSRASACRLDQLAALASSRRKRAARKDRMHAIK